MFRHKRKVETRKEKKNHEKTMKEGKS